MQMPQIKARRNIRISSTRLRYASSLPDSSDPWFILNIQPGSVDLKEIKRAYRQLALKFHPDTRAGNDATEAEQNTANADFARINAAYAFLSGKSKDKPETTESEKKEKKQGRQKVKTSQSGYNSSYSSPSGYGPSYDSSSYGSRTSSHNQRSASHHQRANMRVVRDSDLRGYGYDMNGNPRATPFGTAASTSHTNVASQNIRDKSAKYTPRRDTHAKATSRSPHSTNDFYSRVNTRYNSSASSSASGGGGAPSNGASSPASSTFKSVNVKAGTHRERAFVNNWLANSPFYKGDEVKIVGGPYAGRSGKITSIYPSMVKIVFSNLLDALVENKNVMKSNPEAKVGRNRSSAYSPPISRAGSGSSTKNNHRNAKISYAADAFNFGTKGNGIGSKAYSEIHSNINPDGDYFLITGVPQLTQSPGERSEKNALRKINENWIDNIRRARNSVNTVQTKASQDHCSASGRTSGKDRKNASDNPNWIDDIRGVSDNQKTYAKPSHANHGASGSTSSSAPAVNVEMDGSDSPKIDNVDMSVVNGDTVLPKPSHEHHSSSSSILSSPSVGKDQQNESDNASEIDDRVEMFRSAFEHYVTESKCSEALSSASSSTSPSYSQLSKPSLESKYKPPNDDSSIPKPAIISLNDIALNTAMKRAKLAMQNAKRASAEMEKILNKRRVVKKLERGIFH